MLCKAVILPSPKSGSEPTFFVDSNFTHNKYDNAHLYGGRCHVGCKEDFALAFPKIPKSIKDPWIMAREVLGINNNLLRKRGEKP